MVANIVNNIGMILSSSNVVSCFPSLFVDSAFAFMIVKKTPCFVIDGASACVEGQPVGFVLELPALWRDFPLVFTALWLFRTWMSWLSFTHQKPYRTPKT